MAEHAAEENMVEMEETEMERKRRDAEPVVVPTHTNVLPTTYHHPSLPAATLQAGTRP